MDMSVLRGSFVLMAIEYLADRNAVFFPLKTHQWKIESLHFVSCDPAWFVCMSLACSQGLILWCGSKSSFLLMVMEVLQFSRCNADSLECLLHGS